MYVPLCFSDHSLTRSPESRSSQREAAADPSCLERAWCFAVGV